ncbi:MAG: DUF4405 domain-containing protein [Anaerolineales bacterium]|nr:DUF4405 domain-containing protein [Anaerolineales bacterium]
MKKTNSVSPQTRNNWLIDATVFLGAVIASLTGIYFLFLPVGGYQGGRNPAYGITILFERHTWEDLHLWFGLLMIAAAVIHIAIHWAWIVNMTRRTLAEIFKRQGKLNARSRSNVAINVLIGTSFLITAVTGLYLLFVPGGRGAVDPGWLFNRTTWDLVHTWSGITMISAAVFHFAIHWKWVTKVTGKVLRSVWSIPRFADRNARKQSSVVTE